MLNLKSILNYSKIVVKEKVLENSLTLRAAYNLNGFPLDFQCHFILTFNR